MPYTEHDNNLNHVLRILHEPHSHHIPATNDNRDYVLLNHGGTVHRIYNLRGDWYAVHTH